MSRFWLTYRNSSGHLLGAVVMDSSNLMHARMRSAIEVLDQGALFARGHELDRDTAALVPATQRARQRTKSPCSPRSLPPEHKCM
jgi:hypothetical protein